MSELVYGGLPPKPQPDASPEEMANYVRRLEWELSESNARFARLSVANATTNAALRKVMEFVRDVATNYDHDEDAHKYHTPCRECGAKKLLGMPPERSE